MRAHQIFGGENPGRGHVQRRCSVDVRLARLNLFRAHDRQAFHAVFTPALRQRFEFVLLARVCGNDQLPRLPVWNAVLHAEFVRQPVAFDAVPRLQRSFRIVNTRMNHPAVARARGHSNLRELLHQKHILPLLRNLASDGATDHAPADNQDVGLVHNLEG